MENKQGILLAFKPPFKYDPDSGRVTDSENTLILEIRAFGHLTKFYGNCGEKACEVQDKVGNLVAELLSESLPVQQSPSSLQDRTLRKLAEVLSKEEFEKFLENTSQCTEEKNYERVLGALTNSCRFLGRGVDTPLMSAVLLYAFTWEVSKEGNEYWVSIHDRLRELEKQEGVEW